MPKLTVEDQKELIPDADIRAAFLEREDIAKLSPEDQEERWQRHLLKVNEFREMMSGLNAVII